MCRYNNFLIGAQTGYNTEKGQLTGTNLSFGRDIGAFVVNAQVLVCFLYP